ncbi:MAG TPA: YraN family protein [Actinomycetaceae bacterium]|nr:YraN family protein [Actinomycetaceae bacterium]
MTVQSKAIGEYGERLAARHLEEAGYRLLARNWRCKAGEIDIVAVDPCGALAFVEVKTRHGTGHGHPFEAVTGQKVARLRRLAGAWLTEHPHEGPIRLDAVAVTLRRAGAPWVEHLAGVGE